MADLRTLYQEVIVDHTKSPRNFGELPQASHHAEGYNPLCGDKLSLFLLINDQDIIEDIRFIGDGCSISTASASLMTEMIKGKSLQDAAVLFKDFHHMLTHDGSHDADRMGKLTVLAGVGEFPARVKCATLAWHTLEAAINNKLTPVSTE